MCLSITECFEEYGYVRPDLSLLKGMKVNTDVHKSLQTKLCMVAPKICVTARTFGKLLDPALMNVYVCIYVCIYVCMYVCM
jgi:hypothetical protein